MFRGLAIKIDSLADAVRAGDNSSVPASSINETLLTDLRKSMNVVFVWHDETTLEDLSKVKPCNFTWCEARMVSFLDIRLISCCFVDSKNTDPFTVHVGKMTSPNRHSEAHTARNGIRIWVLCLANSNGSMARKTCAVCLLSQSCLCSLKCD